jgi:hypothetical protein
MGILLIPILIMLPGLAGFPYPPQPGTFSDITVTHYPNALFLRNTISHERTIPLWSPTILSGYPFDANPLSGLLYSPGWLALVLPLPLAFNIGVFLHLWWAGIGMYLLLRAEDLQRFPALLGAVISIALPKLFAHYGAGHLSLLYAIAWTPWLLYVSRRYFITGQSSESPIWRRVLGQPALVWAMVLLADVRWAAFAGLLWWYYLLFHLISERGGKQKLRYLGSLMYQTILGGMIAAPLLIPLAEYASLSTRANMSAADISTFSLPPAKILNLFVPDFGGFYEWITYCGALVFLLLILGFSRSKQTTTIWCWLGAAAFSLIFALGSNLPLFSSLANVPGLNLLRVPSRMVFITGISLAAVAAHQLQWLISGLSTKEDRRLRLFLAGIISFILMLTFGAWLISHKLPTSFIWVSTLILLSAFWLTLMRERLATRVWELGLLAICLFDLCVVDVSLFTTHSATSVLSESEEVASYLSKQSGEFRVYSPTYSLPQQTAAVYGLEMASGVDPLQLKSYAEFMEAASGIQQNGYSVVLPYLFSEAKASADKPVPDAHLLGLLNVGYILSAYPLLADGLDYIGVYDKQILYQNRYILPRAWVEHDNELNPVEGVSSAPNNIRITAKGPGRLYLSEISYPGWKVWVDHQPADIDESLGVLRSVQLGDGKHEIVFRYLPKTLYFGVGLMGLGVLLAIVFRRSGL